MNVTRNSLSYLIVIQEYLFNMFILNKNLFIFDKYNNSSSDLINHTIILVYNNKIFFILLMIFICT